MKLFKLTTLSPLLAGLLVFASAEDALDTALGDEGQITEPTAESSLTAPIPVELKHLLIEKPHVDFTVLIDEEWSCKRQYCDSVQSLWLTIRCTESRGKIQIHACISSTESQPQFAIRFVSTSGTTNRRSGATQVEFQWGVT